MTDPGEYDGWTLSIDPQWQKVTVRIPTECLLASRSKYCPRLASSVDGALVLCFSRSGVAVDHARQDVGSCDDIGSIEIAGTSEPSRAT